METMSTKHRFTGFGISTGRYSYSDVAEHFRLSEAWARIIIQQTLPKMKNQLDYFVAWRFWVEQGVNLPEASRETLF